jgi:acetolactate decarboxylase
MPAPRSLGALGPALSPQFTLEIADQLRYLGTKLKELNMRLQRVLPILLAPMVFILTSCTSTRQPDTVSQVSTINALLAGVYDGDMSLNDLLKHGNFGLGTFDKLDGEMIVLDGEIYQAKSDGKIYRPDLSMLTPFAAVVEFSADKTCQLESGDNFKAVEDMVNRECPNQNLFCAIKIRGTFSYMKVRAIPRQHKPYPPLVEAAKHQPVFEMKNTTGTIVGYRTPEYFKGIGVPGFHLHYISDDHQKGGHILELTVANANAELDVCNKFYLVLPDNNAAFGKTNLKQDRSAELNKVEK